jgi:hypothetical protein
MSLLCYKYIKKRIIDKNSKVEGKFGSDPNEINRLINQNMNQEYHQIEIPH